MTQLPIDSVAIVGMALRFPGASSISQFWSNLCRGVESISQFSEETLVAEGVPSELLRDPHYVRAGGVLEGVELFDATLFNFSPTEAELMDPQQRLFLECAWESLENAGYCADGGRARVGVFGGVGVNRYLLFNFDREMLTSGSSLRTVTGNDKDYLTTRVSYKLGLTGPSICVQTACSTSLVAVHLACRSLLDYQTDLALAGAASLRLPQRSGYFFEEGGIVSPDGHCRAFDASAAGTVFSSGVGVVVLKRLEEAVEDGDTIHAIIRGGAVNNDGAVKVGFTAPSIESQAEVIAEAIGVADVDARTIGYVETHGTGTTLGDPIEISALTRAFQGWTSEKQTCPIGSVKTNIGHLDTAAGVAGLIKTVLALKHQQIPPSLNFKSPNPRIDFSASPFYVNAALSDWKTSDNPRRAGVSSFGLGGTNCHLVVEEAPAVRRRKNSLGGRSFHVVPLSAKNDAALGDTASALKNYLSSEEQAELGDIAFTYQVGRKTFPHRRVIVARSTAELASAAVEDSGKSIFSSVEESVSRPVVFLFPGQGSHFVGMGQRFYETESAFRKTIDYAAEVLKDRLPGDLREVLFHYSGAGEQNLTHTSVLQPALFAVEYALAEMWQSWGIKPRAMMGHSLGEYVAACVAGVMSFEDGLRLMARRGALIGRLPAGAMLSIRQREAEVQQLLSEALSVAAVNAEDRVVVSGPADEISRLEQRLTADGIISQRLETSHAFHSGMMDPILEEFRAAANQVTLSAPSIPYVSNLTGNWIEADEATDPDYWVRHLRFAVRFHDGLRTLLKDPEVALLETGPGRVLVSLVNYSRKGVAWLRLFTSMPGPNEPSEQEEHLHRTLGQLWLAGVPVAWDEFQKGQSRGRIPLPGYAFQRERYWVSSREQEADKLSARKSTGPKGTVELYVPSWQREPRAPGSAPDLGTPRLVIHEGAAAASAIAERLRLINPDTITACAGAQFRKHDESTYTFDIESPDDYDHLISSLSAGGRIPAEIVHLLNVGPGKEQVAQNSPAKSFYSLLWLLRAVGKYVQDDPVHVIVFSSNAQPVHSREPLEPIKALIAGPCSAASEEYPNITCRWVDTDITDADQASVDRMLSQLAEESDSVSPVAYRRDQRFVRSFSGLLLPPDTEKGAFRENGVYLITGGFGGIGMAIARYLARESRARLILMSRTPLPDRAEWKTALQQMPEADVVAQRIRDVLELEQLGATVLIGTADVSDEARVRSVVEMAHRTFGSIHGIIHAAGVAGGHMIQTTDYTTADNVLAPKLKGAFVLAELFRTSPLDFFVVCSSLQSIKGGAGQSEYAAANAFLDALAHWMQSVGTPCMAINWDTWGDVGMATKAAVPAALGISVQSALSDGLTSETAVAVFASLVSMPYPQVVVCRDNLHTRLRSKSRRLAEIVSSAHGNGFEPKPAHQRPELFTQYVPPSTPIEQTVAEVWQEVLGLDRVGLDDSIFELGGDSVSAIHVSQKLSEKLGATIPPVRIFTASTVRALAATLTSAPTAEADLAERQSRGARRRAKRLSA